MLYRQQLETLATQEATASSLPEAAADAMRRGEPGADALVCRAEALYHLAQAARALGLIAAPFVSLDGDAAWIQGNACACSREHPLFAAVVAVCGLTGYPAGGTLQ